MSITINTCVGYGWPRRSWITVDVSRALDGTFRDHVRARGEDISQMARELPEWEGEDLALARSALETGEHAESRVGEHLSFSECYGAAGFEDRGFSLAHLPGWRRFGDYLDHLGARARGLLTGESEFVELTDGVHPYQKSSVGCVMGNDYIRPDTRHYGRTSMERPIIPLFVVALVDWIHTRGVLWDDPLAVCRAARPHYAQWWI